MATRRLFENEDDAICICSGFCKYGQILLKFGMQVNIGQGMIENENRVQKCPQLIFLHVSGPLEIFS